MDIRIIKNQITKEELKQIAVEGFGDLVKAVVDLKHEIMAVGGELHADEEVLLVEQEGSQREDTWGINLYPDRVGDDFIENETLHTQRPGGREVV